MKVLVIGGGGREHAIVWALNKSPLVKEIICAPGNPGIAQRATCYPVDAESIDGLLALAKRHKVDLVIVGPEAPLVAGLADLFRAEGIPVVGPSKKAARIEGSKIFCKNLMTKYHIPTADFSVFTYPYNASECIKALADSDFPIVIKADGLAAGKGVKIAHNHQEAYDAVATIMIEQEFGEAGNRILIEEFLDGPECSIIVATDGQNIMPFPASRDYKPAYDGNQGPNTGGMGAFAPLPDISDELFETIIATIIQPTIKAMADEGYPYQGILYAGLKLTANGPKVLEYNCRFGDPETQVVLPLLKSDFAELMMATATGWLADYQPEWHNQFAVCVVMTSRGYPKKSKTDFPITGLELIDPTYVTVFHAGTAINDQNQIVTNGGRVLGIVGTDEKLFAARGLAYWGVEQIKFLGKLHRTDIAL
ncbi:MAG: phosphoribosylamine--glycine ligase [bacterium]|nr:phosphoribosylamine--glycine ligase [bacterium]